MYITLVATKKTRKTKEVKAEVKPVEKVQEAPQQPAVEAEEQLDPQEEKVLDWILKAVVTFILGWLGLSILMVIGGYFHLWG